MVMIHEIGHSLGIVSGNDDNDPIPSGPVSPFESFLKYDHSWDTTRDPFEPRWFFHGPLAMEVFGGPVPMEDAMHQQEKSHFNLRNTDMTHRVFRNYSAFVEVEMAALVDSGYDIDLRNYFGRSIYTDNNNIVNQQGFFARNPQGTAYLPGLPNHSAYGMGLHIYGDNNTVYQAADLLADGPAAAGIRADGVNTKLFITPSTRISANGPRGTGLLVAYGSNSVVVHQGSVEASDQAGDAVRFDIGAGALDFNFADNPDGYGVRAQYANISIDDYTESGWGLQAQSRDSTSNSFWRSDLGAELLWQPTQAITVSGRLGWVHIYGDRQADLKAYFSADPASPFISYGDPLNRDSMSVALAVSFPLGQSLSIKLDYQGDFGPESSSHGGEIAAVFEF